MRSNRSSRWVVVKGEVNRWFQRHDRAALQVFGLRGFGPRPVGLGYDMSPMHIKKRPGSFVLLATGR